MINGRKYDWEGIEIRLPHGTAIDISEITYKDERPLGPRYGKGGISTGYGRKNYKAEGSMTLYLEEAARLQAALGGTVYSSTLFDIYVGYAETEESPTITDILPQCKITTRDTSAKQGEDVAGETKFDFEIFSPIKWDETPAYK
ncbi:conserved hypothetical protein [Candidatus Magnetomoraceae bacterium gMMP-15]